MLQIMTLEGDVKVDVCWSEMHVEREMASTCCSQGPALAHSS
jgi:hypothetical protein